MEERFYTVDAYKLFKLKEYYEQRADAQKAIAEDFLKQYTQEYLKGFTNNVTYSLFKQFKAREEVSREIVDKLSDLINEAELCNELKL